MFRCILSCCHFCMQLKQDKKSKASKYKHSACKLYLPTLMYSLTRCQSTYILLWLVCIFRVFFRSVCALYVCFITALFCEFVLACFYSTLISITIAFYFIDKILSYKNEWLLKVKINKASVYVSKQIEGILSIKHRSVFNLSRFDIQLLQYQNTFTYRSITIPRLF